MSLPIDKTLRLVRVLLYLAFFTLLIVALRRVAMVVAPVATGLFLAYLINPSVARLERRRVPRPVAITLLLLAFAVAAGGLLAILPPLLSDEIGRFAERWNTYQERLLNVVLPWARKTLHLIRGASAEETARQILTRLEGAWATASGTVTTTIDGAFRTATGLLRVLLAALLTPVFAIYFLSDYPHLRDAARSLVPPRHRERTFQIVSEINHALASWVRGQLTVMFVLGTLYSTGLALTGVPLGIAIGLLTGLMAFVPYVGVLVGLAVALVVALLDPAPAHAIAGVLVTFGAVQTLDALVITPRILGGRVGLSPVAVIFALTLGGELLGYAGVILAVPAAAVVKVLLAHARGVYEHSPFYTGEALAAASSDESRPAATAAQGASP